MLMRRINGDSSKSGRSLSFNRQSNRNSYFPYEWFQDVSQLNETCLPEPDAFYSTVKAANTLGNDPDEIAQTYQGLQDLWREKSFRTMRDFLIYYSTCDTVPFVQAVEAMQAYYWEERGIDLFHDGISVPGLARKLLFKSARGTPFALFSPRDRDLFETYRANLFGGLSVIFHRWVEAGVTPVGPQTNAEMCDSVIGMDANGLYGWALRSKLPTGPHLRWKPTDEQFQSLFIPQIYVGLLLVGLGS